MENTVQPAGQAGPGPGQGSSNTGKIIVIVVAVLGALCLISCAAILLVMRSLGNTLQQNVKSDPGEVSALSQEIADFEVPSGFQPQNGMRMVGFTFVFYESPQTDTAIILMQMPISREINDQTMSQFEDAMDRQFNRGTANFQVVDRYETTIRGQPALVILQEGTNAEEQSFRQMNVFFQGKGGLSMLSIIGPAGSWDQAAYDRLIKSIR